MNRQGVIKKEAEVREASQNHHHHSPPPLAQSITCSSRSGLPMTHSSRIAQMNRITEHLFLSGCRGLNAYDIETNSIRHVINTTLEIPIMKLSTVDYTRIPVNDLPSENIYRYFDQVADEINAHAAANENVLIHCVAGVSRSASFVLAYLMKHLSMNLREAYKYLHSKRSVVRPNNGFFSQLIEFEKKLYGVNTVQMIKIKSFDEQDIEVPDLYANEFKKMALLEIVVRRRNRLLTERLNRN